MQFFVCPHFLRYIGLCRRQCSHTLPLSLFCTSHESCPSKLSNLEGRESKKRGSVEFGEGIEANQSFPSAGLGTQICCYVKKRCMAGVHPHTWTDLYLNVHTKTCEGTNAMQEKNVGCSYVAGLISSIWAWGLMHLLRLLTTMSPVDTGWTRHIISLALTESTTVTTATTTTNHYHENPTSPVDLYRACRFPPC